MRLSLAPTGLRCGLPRRAAQRSQRAPMLVVRAQVGEQGPAAVEQQQAAPQVPPAEAAAQQEEEVYDEAAVAVADVAAGPSSVSEEQQAWQAVAPPPPPAEPRGSRFAVDLQHPGFKVAGISAAVFLGGTLLLTLWRMSRDPQRKRSKTINKNKLVVDTISKYLPGNRAGMSGASFALLKMQTGFSNVELFRKYLWFLLRERQYDEEALGDLVALKAALSLSDDEAAEALSERAERVYEKYGTVMVNMEGMTQAGIERKAASRNLFIKLLSLTEARALLSAEAASKVDLGRIFGVTPRDILTLRSGYSAEAEGGEGEGEEAEEQ
ncbi:hypothetical protein ABPG75_000457 [Micractinium tetrahymenae]